MLIFGVESSGQTASVALADKHKIIFEYTINNKLTHSETLMPMVENACRLTGFDIKDVDYVACSQGPGSFTGLRIGASIAKGIAQGLDKKMIPVPTLDSLAYNIFDNEKIVCPIMDARRNEVYGSFYAWNEGELVRLTDYFAKHVDKVLEMTRSFHKSVIFLGDGVPVHQDYILSQSGAFSFAPAYCRLQKASSLCAIAQTILDTAVSYDSFTPFYLRVSQAERLIGGLHD